MSKLLNTELQDEVWRRVTEILGGDDSGHGTDHVKRVQTMALRFASEMSEPVNITVVSLAAQLHDVDDYKLVGREQAEKLTNTTEIMKTVGIDEATQQAVRDIVANMGYSKALKGIRPTSLEGKIVSDADMCDASGASGIIRALTYAVSSKGSGVVFDLHCKPDMYMTAEKYNVHGTTCANDSFVNHFFEKLFKLKGMMLTNPGRAEAQKRDELMADFLRQYFYEENVPEWSDLLEEYLKERKI